MLLTLKPPSQNGIKGPHEYSIVRQSIPTPRTSSTPPAPDRPSTPAPLKRATERAMDSSRRGLPPPSSMTLPPPDPGLPTIAPIGQLPPPPPQWQNADESMRQWLQTRAEDDRRRQEEEKTRQESLRLEQRKIEQSMLRESFQAGVPPHMIPLIFAGIGGAHAQNSMTLELAQHYIAQMNILPPQGQPQPQQQASQVPQPQPQPTLPPPPPPAQSAHQSQPLQQEVRRDNRTIPPNPYGAQPAAQPAVPNLPGPSQQRVPASPPQHVYGHGHPPLLSPADPRGPPAASLSRLNTAEMHIHHPPANIGAGQYQPGPPPPPPPPASVKQESQQQQASPSIYFHHWVPPGQSQPNTPSGKSTQDSPYSSHTHSHLRSEYQSSPGRKRKAQGTHQPAPPPSSHAPDASPAMSHPSPRQTPPGSAGRRSGPTGHLHQRSDVATVHESRYQRELTDLEQRRSIPRPTTPARGSSAERDHTRGDQRRDSSGAPAGVRSAGAEEHRRYETATQGVPQSHYMEVHPGTHPGPYAYPTSRDSASNTAAPVTASEPASENPPSGPAQGAMRPRDSM